MPGIFPFMRDIVEGSREIWLLSDTYGRTLTGLESIDDIPKYLSLHFDRATHGGHFTEYYREVFIILTAAGTPQATPRPERVDVKEVSEQIYALSTDTVDSRLVLPESPLVSSTSTSRRYDPFSHVAPQTCFPAPYPPPPAPCLPRSALPTSFIPPTPPRDVRSLTSHNPDMRMTTTTLETCSRIPRSHGVFYIPDPNSIKPLSPILSPSVAANSTMPRAVSEESIVSTDKADERTPEAKDSLTPDAHNTPITPPPIERVVEVTPPHYAFASSQKARLVSSLPSLYSAEASCVAMPKSPTAGQRKPYGVWATAGETFSYTYTVSRSPPLVSDTTSYIDSPPTSSDDLDTPPSTPPRSRVLLARTSTEDLVISSVSQWDTMHASGFHEGGWGMGRATAHLHF
ncbi:hypothetical protein EDB92DRAFT_1839273 [Lactarius akahatsu]|uniref:Uncharacterized protein n=1 Tax=Lactarius akahatsu TaxID=416441 RepID=A0AAD4LQW7_9AGAM|nr:hypothetical protein EDB92DRAFT_1839273 [Lactarius akahatsu]